MNPKVDSNIKPRDHIAQATLTLYCDRLFLERWNVSYPREEAQDIRVSTVSTSHWWTIEFLLLTGIWLRGYCWRSEIIQKQLHHQRAHPKTGVHPWKLQPGALQLADSSTAGLSPLHFGWAVSSSRGFFLYSALYIVPQESSRFFSHIFVLLFPSGGSRASPSFL